MRKAIIISGFVLIILLIIGRLTWFNDKAIISREITSIGNALSSQEIDELDKYLSNTHFISNEKEINYVKAKKNIKKAFMNSKIQTTEKGLYCTSIDVNSNVAVSNIIGWIITEKDGSTEMDIKAKFQRKGLYNWRIIELKSNDDAFKYLFFDGA